MQSELTFKIVGPDADRGLVALDEFVRFCDTIQKCLKASESIVSGATGKFEYRITDLRCESATIKLRPIRKSDHKADGKEVISFFRSAVSNLQRGKVDPRIPISELESFRDLVSPLKRKATRVMVGRTRITDKLGKTIGKLLDDNLTSDGTVTGMLERINVHDRHEFVIYPPLFGTQITCSFPESILDDVRSAIKRNVTVTGTQFYRGGNSVPHRIHVSSLEIHPLDSELPTLNDVRRLGKWETNGMTALEFVRAIRDE